MTSIATAFALGFGAGISPGPLLTLVLTSTLQRGFGAGLRVALAPLLTDAPIVILAVAVVGSIQAAVTWPGSVNSQTPRPSLNGNPPTPSFFTWQ